MVITPTLFIGLGGTGKAVLYDVRRRLVSKFGEDLTKVPAFKFLALDTAGESRPGGSSAGIERAIAFSGIEHRHLTISRDRFQQIKNTVRMNAGELPPHLRGWLTYEMVKDHDDIHEGAGQVRGLGRLALLENLAQVKPTLETVWTGLTADTTAPLTATWIQTYLGLDANTEVPVNPGARQIFIVGSLLGGTGSGTFIDVGYLVSDLCGQPGEAYLTIPLKEVQLGDVDCRANACAALIELNHYLDEGRSYTPPWDIGTPRRDRPFDFTHLLSTKHASVAEGGSKTYTVAASDLVSMIGHYMFLRATSEFSKQVTDYRDNFKTPLAAPDSKARGNNQRYLTFGLSVIEIPVQNLVESCAARLAKMAMDELVGDSAGKNAPSISDHTVTEALVRLGISEDAVADALTSAAGGVALRNWYASKISGMSSGIASEILMPWASLTRVVQTVQATQRELDERLSGDGLRKVAGSIEEHLADTARNCREKLDKELNSILSRDRKGTGYATALLQALQKRFTEMEQGKKSPVDMLEKIDARAKELAASSTIIRGLVSDTLLSWYRRPVVSRYIAGRHARLMQDLCKLRLDHMLAPFEAEIFRELRERTQQLGDRVTALAQFLRVESREFEERSRTAADLTTTAIRNLLYTRDDPKRGIEGDPQKWWKKVMSGKEGEENLRNYLNSALMPLITDSNGPDLLRLLDSYSSSLDRDIFRDTLMQRARNVFARLQKESDVVARFLEQNDSVTAREGAIRTAVSGSDPYLALRYNDADYTYKDSDMHSSGVLIRDPDTADEKPRSLIDSLLNGLGVQARGVKTVNPAAALDERHLIIVHQHLAGFPIRIMADMDGLKQVYDQVLSARGKALHTMPSDFRWTRWSKPNVSVLTERKQTFIAARALQVLREVRLRSGQVVLEFGFDGAGGKRTTEFRGTLSDAAGVLLDDSQTYEALVDCVEQRRRDLDERAVAKLLVDFMAGVEKREDDVPTVELKEYWEAIDSYAAAFGEMGKIYRSMCKEQGLGTSQYVRVFSSGRAECRTCGQAVSKGQKECSTETCERQLQWPPETNAA